MTPIRITLWLALLLGSTRASAPPPPAHPAATCTVFGSIFVAVDDTLPEPYAEVRVLGTRSKTLSDEDGHFVLHGLAPGRVVLGIRAVGGPLMLDTLDLVAGKSIRRDYRIDQAWARYEKTLDSLTALDD